MLCKFKFIGYGRRKKVKLSMCLRSLIRFLFQILNQLNSALETSKACFVLNPKVLRLEGSFLESDPTFRLKKCHYSDIGNRLPHIGL